jgi:hypothetical protein
MPIFKCVFSSPLALWERAKGEGKPTQPDAEGLEIAFKTAKQKQVGARL